MRINQRERQKKLNRLIKLELRMHYLRMDGSEAEAKELETPEYFRLRKELVQEFRQTLNDLMQARLLHVMIDTHGKPFSGMLCGEVHTVGESGGSGWSLMLSADLNHTIELANDDEDLDLDPDDEEDLYDPDDDPDEDDDEDLDDEDEE